MRVLAPLLLTTSLALTLAACGKKEEAPAPAATETAVATDAAAAAGRTEIPVGKFDVYDAAGTTKTATVAINADGTYTSDPVKGLREAGIVKIVDGKTCFDPSGKAPEECYTDSAPAADGSFTATNSKGEVETVRPVK